MLRFGGVRAIEYVLGRGALIWLQRAILFHILWLLFRQRFTSASAFTYALRTSSSFSCSAHCDAVSFVLCILDILRDRMSAMDHHLASARFLGPLLVAVALGANIVPSAFTYAVHISSSILCSPEGRKHCLRDLIRLCPAQEGQPNLSGTRIITIIFISLCSRASMRSTACDLMRMSRSVKAPKSAEQCM